jgi:Protein of unknown function (DUF3896)
VFHMNYQEVKEQLEVQKQNLVKKLENTNLSKEEYESIQMSIDNYEYIIDLTEMNYYERGITH